MIALNITGDSALEILNQLRGFLATGLSGETIGKTAGASTSKAATANASTNTATATGASSGKEVTREMVRAAWAEKKDAGVKREKALEVLGKYGVTKLDELGPEHYAAAHAEFLKLTL